MECSHRNLIHGSLCEISEIFFFLLKGKFYTSIHPKNRKILTLVWTKTLTGFWATSALISWLGWRNWKKIRLKQNQKRDHSTLATAKLHCSLGRGKQRWKTMWWSFSLLWFLVSQICRTRLDHSSEQSTRLSLQDLFSIENSNMWPRPPSHRSYEVKSRTGFDVCHIFLWRVSHEGPLVTTVRICQNLVLNYMPLPTDPIILVCLLIDLTTNKKIYADLIWTGTGWPWVERLNPR